MKGPFILFSFSLWLCYLWKVMLSGMRTYQGIFHANPDYAYWYGWAPMTKALDEIREMAEDLRFKAKAQQKGR